jgi:hypothetical protein
MASSPFVLLAATALALLALGCEDVSHFSTTGDEAYCGTVVAGSEFREGLGPDAVMSLTLDASRLDGPGSPGAITAGEPRAKDGALVKLLDQAPLRIIKPLQHDPLSQLTFGDGRDRNAIYAVAPEDPKDASLVAVLSLMHDDSVEVRLLRPAGAGQSQIYGLFSLVRKTDGCGF